MAYQGFLLQLGDYKVPHSFIKAESYKTTYNSQDLDSYVDNDGYLHMNRLAHFRPKVEFETPPLLTETKKEILMSNIRRNYINADERRLNAKIWVPELGQYVEDEVYLSDTEYSIYGTYDEEIKYNQFRLAFISF